MNQTYSQRAKLSLNPTAQRLFHIMDEKQSNLCVAADLTESAAVLDLAEKIGPHICLFKTHIDILDDFTPDFITRLQETAEKHNFLIFEDRKFADIGNTVKHQYQDGIYRIADWAHITNAHTVPGPGIIEGLKQVGLPKGRGLLLLAEMSPKGNLAKGSYTKESIRWAEENAEFVIGFISIGRLSSDPSMLHMTPGVKLQEGTDPLGQQYLTPSHIITDKNSDIIIVGRGITQSPDPATAAQTYQTAGWSAHLTRL